MTYTTALTIAKSLETQCHAIGKVLACTCTHMEAKAKLKKVRLDHGKVLGAGISRLALGIGPWVVKYQFNGQQNQHEAYCWKVLRDTKWAKYFAPVLHANKKWLVMPRGKAYTETNGTIVLRSMKGCLTKAAKEERYNRMVWDVLFGTGWDLHEGNIARVGGRNVVIDYGLST